MGEPARRAKPAFAPRHPVPTLGRGPLHPRRLHRVPGQPVAVLAPIAQRAFAPHPEFAAHIRARRNPRIIVPVLPGAPVTLGTALGARDAPGTEPPEAPVLRDGRARVVEPMAVHAGLAVAAGAPGKAPIAADLVYQGFHGRRIETALITTVQAMMHGHGVTATTHHHVSINITMNITRSVTALFLQLVHQLLLPQPQHDLFPVVIGPVRVQTRLADPAITLGLPQAAQFPRHRRPRVLGPMAVQAAIAQGAGGPGIDPGVAGAGWHRWPVVLGPMAVQTTFAAPAIARAAVFGAGVALQELPRTGIVEAVAETARVRA